MIKVSAKLYITATSYPMLAIYIANISGKPMVQSIKELGEKTKLY